MNTIRSYRIEEAKDTGINVLEDMDGWLWVQGDPLNRKFFIIEDIEKELCMTLTLTKTKELNKTLEN